MKVHAEQDLASRSDPESCASDREVRREALKGAPDRHPVKISLAALELPNCSGTWSVAVTAI
jgi:hypothetical protein